MTAWPEVRGFNYAPSYGSSGLDLWLRFDADVVASELARGLAHFPGIDTIRLWLSHDAFDRDRTAFTRNVESSLRIADGLGLRVMPVLFNRWHSKVLDFGGVYLDHFMPGWSWLVRPGMFDDYLAAIVGEHSDDPRVVAWDTCNEPFSYGRLEEMPATVVDAEYAWLSGLYDRCKELGAHAPVTVSAHSLEGRAGLERVEAVSDVLSIHPYYLARPHRHLPQLGGGVDAFRRLLDEYVDLASQVGKPLVATECCWGSFDDAERVELVRVTLTELTARGIGWLAHILQHSLVADAHRPGAGPVAEPGYMAFVEADGSLRPGHEVVNEFCP